MIAWTYDSLWQKAKLYAERAMKEDREGPLFPLWATFCLEFLGRATLAGVHSALLADPREGENLLYAFGYGTLKNPRSVPAKTVFSRCQVIVPNFTEDEFNKTMLMMERRNEELHAGSPVFEELKTQFWLADYFRICKLLLVFQGRSLEDLFGKEEAVGAEKMIHAAAQKVVAEVRRTIAAAAEAFSKLEPTDREESLKKAEAACAPSTGTLGRRATCPACGGCGVLEGERISAGDPRLDDQSGSIVRDIVVLPTEFHCFSCGLQLRGHGALHAAELGGNYTVGEELDPVEYFNIEFDPSQFVEPDYDEYGND